MIDREELKELIKDAIEETFFSNDEFSPLNSLQDKVNKLIDIREAEEKVSIAIKWADKFEDYMKNIDKLNQLINEFKGLVSIVRSEQAKKSKE